MNRSLLVSTIAVVLLIGGLGVSGQMMNQSGEQDQPTAQTMPMDREAMMERCQQMMQRMQQAQERMQQMDQQLQEQVQAMDAAQGEAKVDAMAEVIRTLVEQRQQMHQHRQQMMQRMMGHMGQHMQMGGEDGKQGMMMRCPMMQGGMMQPPTNNAQTVPAEPERDAQP